MTRSGFQGRYLLDSGGSLRAQVIFRASRTSETKAFKLNGSYSGDWGAWWAAQGKVSLGFSMLRTEQYNSLAMFGRGTALVSHVEVASIRWKEEDEGILYPWDGGCSICDLFWPSQEGLHFQS